MLGSKLCFLFYNTIELFWVSGRVGFEIEVSALCLNRVAETRVMRRRGAPEILESLAANWNSLSETSAFVSESRKIGPAKTSSLQKVSF